PRVTPPTVIRPWPRVNHRRSGSEIERIASIRQRPPAARRESGMIRSGVVAGASGIPGTARAAPVSALGPDLGPALGAAASPLLGFALPDASGACGSAGRSENCDRGVPEKSFTGGSLGLARAVARGRGLGVRDIR